MDISTLTHCEFEKQIALFISIKGIGKQLLRL